MYLLDTFWIHCLRNHNEITMYLLDKCPLSPSLLWVCWFLFLYIYSPVVDTTQAIYLPVSLSLSRPPRLLVVSFIVEASLSSLVIVVVVLTLRPRLVVLVSLTSAITSPLSLCRRRTALPLLAAIARPLVTTRPYLSPLPAAIAQLTQSSRTLCSPPSKLNHSYWSSTPPYSPLPSRLPTLPGSQHLHRIWG